MMASRADDRTAEDLRQRFLVHSVDHEDLWYLYRPADVSDGSDAPSGATYDLQLQGDIAECWNNYPSAGHETDPRPRWPSTYLSANHASRSLSMEQKSSHRTRSSQKRAHPDECATGLCLYPCMSCDRPPTEEEVPYTPADRLAAEMMGIPLHKLDRSGRPVTCASVCGYEWESDSRLRMHLRRKTEAGPAHIPNDVPSTADFGIGDRDADERPEDCVDSCQTDLDCCRVRPRYTDQMLKPVCRAARCFSALCSYSRAILQLLFRRPWSSRRFGWQLVWRKHPPRR